MIISLYLGMRKILILLLTTSLILCTSKTAQKDDAPGSKLNDTVYTYYDNGVIKNKGRKINEFEIGWWFYYNLSGKVKEKIEYKLSNDTIYSNQIIAYGQMGNIDYDNSRFYKVIIPDTLKLGKNIGELQNFSNFKREDKNIYVVIKNKYNNGEIKNDTFAEKPDFTRFGINANHTGKKLVFGTFVEEVWVRRTLGVDSISATRYEYKKYFEKEVYVKDTLNF